MGIHKIEVARGIQWVEIPEADLRILCGCPADAVKHMLKRGLILEKELKGVACETGPNAILLSDLALQNGEFANLAEFPVLQMLYKQGLILPGHPNNTGRKPLLIGSAEQVDSQLRYIYRGNYGLVSREEIIETGVPEAQADEMMRIKLKFAFGRIRPTSDFLDTRVIGDGTVEIANGVSVRRLHPNIFEFSYQGETIKVDLNLSPGETYDCPYLLGFRRFESEYFAVIHNGDGDGWDVNRPCMSSIITYQGRIYMIDAGPNIANSMVALGMGINQVDGIFHTHAHDDHFAGLTTMMRAGRRIRYFATPLVRASVAKKLAALMGIEEEQFADFFEIHDLVADAWNNIEGLEVMPAYSPHPVETTIFTFRALWGDGYRTYAHLADIASLDVLRDMVTDRDEAPGINQAAFDRFRSAYLVAADVKKVDVGGGLIHGNAKDFRDDASTRILLAHRAGELMPEEKEIGSSAVFGSVDVLVAGQSDFMHHHAFYYLASHLPGVALHELRLLLNHPMTEINPGAIILKEGEISCEVLLLLTGRVEKLRTRDDMFGSLSAGAMIGVGCVLDNRPSQNTYRAASFVRLIRLPAGVYTEVIRRNGLLDHMSRTANLRAFLDSIHLFNEGIPAVAIERIIDNASERSFAPGEFITGADLQVLNLIRSGIIERDIGSANPEVLKERDYFGELGAIFKLAYLSRLRVRETATVIQIPGEVLQDVPILRWKLLMGYQQRVARVVYSDDPAEVFIWRDTFSIGVAKVDLGHRRLIAIANEIMGCLHGNSGHDALVKCFGALEDFTRHHFAAEEKKMKAHGYPGAKAHCKKHAELLAHVSDYCRAALGGETPDKASFQYFFETWLTRHILREDRKCGAFLNDKGVF